MMRAGSEIIGRRRHLGISRLEKEVEVHLDCSRLLLPRLGRVVLSRVFPRRRMSNLPLDPGWNRCSCSNSIGGNNMQLWLLPGRLDDEARKLAT